MPGSVDDLRHALLDAGLLRRASVDGVYARSAAFEDVVRGVEDVVAAADPASSPRWYLPNVMARSALERSGYVASFPDLVGSIGVFAGGDREHRDLLRRLDAGEDWGADLSSSPLALCAAACHSLYELLPRDVPAGGLHASVEGTVFRHEPSPDPMRMTTFRMYELVHVGTPDSARAHRDDWVGRAVDVLSSLGLHGEPTAANDPFFGRLGGLKADNQRAEELKVEVVVRVAGDEGHAVASANRHLDHFAEPYGLRLPDGSTAHSACVGFGLERVAIALFAAHGTCTRGWPAEVRSRLGVGA